MSTLEIFLLVELIGFIVLFAAAARQALSLETTLRIKQNRLDDSIQLQNALLRQKMELEAELTEERRYNEFLHDELEQRVGTVMMRQLIADFVLDDDEEID